MYSVPGRCAVCTLRAKWLGALVVPICRLSIHSSVGIQIERDGN